SIATPAFPQNPDLQIAPNPSNGLFNIAYNNYESGKVNILVTNMLGETVAQLLNNDMPKGRINTLFDATQLPSGVYLVNVYTSSGIATKRIVKIE
ncbi:MAG: T9SS type A sorting domain-containing protein, partial [Chitinophagales bacterium]|nr:T9SS type A sorting domain-containing protein [Chitinophagales bacterium]